MISTQNILYTSKFHLFYGLIIVYTEAFSHYRRPKYHLKKGWDHKKKQVGFSRWPENLNPQCCVLKCLCKLVFIKGLSNHSQITPKAKVVQKNFTILSPKLILAYAEDILSDSGLKNRAECNAEWCKSVNVERMLRMYFFVLQRV